MLMTKTRYESTDKTILRATFDIVGITVIVAGVAGKKIHVVAIHMTNNDTASREIVHIFERGAGQPATNLYGGDRGAVYLERDGFHWGLPYSPEVPWFILGTARNLSLWPPGGRRISGFVNYYIE